MCRYEDLGGVDYLMALDLPAGSDDRRSKDLMSPCTSRYQSLIGAGTVFCAGHLKP